MVSARSRFAWLVPPPILSTMVGEFMMHNPAQAQDILHCADLGCLSMKTGTIGYEPLPATAVVLRNGYTLDITHYQVIVLGLGVVIFISALACAMRTTPARILVLAFAAVSLALTLKFFRAQPPMLQEVPADRIVLYF